MRKNHETHLADSRETEIPTDYDLLLTDPPYRKPYRSGRHVQAEGIVGDDQDVSANLARWWTKIRPHRHGYVFGPEHPLGVPTVPLVWDKTYLSSGDLSLPVLPSHEQLHLYIHRYRSERGNPRVHKLLMSGTVLAAVPPRGRATRHHPNQKPIALLARLIEMSTHPGDLVVDPYAGSGSTGVAAILAGRRFLGIEMDEGYYARMVGRLARAEELRGQMDAA